MSLGPSRHIAYAGGIRRSLLCPATLARMQMATKSVQTLLEDIRLLDEQNYKIVEAVRALVQKTFTNESEEIKHGGILFTSGVQFGGVFACKAHRSVEFGSGAKLIDELGQFEGSAKGRRHIKLLSVADIKTKNLTRYLALAVQAANEVQAPAARAD